MFEYWNNFGELKRDVVDYIEEHEVEETREIEEDEQEAPCGHVPQESEDPNATKSVTIVPFQAMCREVRIPASWTLKQILDAYPDLKIDVDLDPEKMEQVFAESIEYVVRNCLFYKGDYEVKRFMPRQILEFEDLIFGKDFYLIETNDKHYNFLLRICNNYLCKSITVEVLKLFKKILILKIDKSKLFLKKYLNFKNSLKVKKIDILKKIKQQTSNANIQKQGVVDNLHTQIRFNPSQIKSKTVTVEEIKNTPLLKAYYQDTLGLDTDDQIIDIDIFKVKNGRTIIYFGINSEFLDKKGINVLTTPIGDAVLIDT